MYIRWKITKPLSMFHIQIFYDHIFVALVTNQCMNQVNNVLETHGFMKRILDKVASDKVASDKVASGQSSFRTFTS